MTPCTFVRSDSRAASGRALPEPGTNVRLCCRPPGSPVVPRYERTSQMPTTQTVKRRTAATKRSTTAKKAAATRARNSAASNASRAKTNAKRAASTPSAQKTVRPVVAQAEFVGAVVNNTVQTAVTAGTKVVSGAAKRVANFL